VFDLRENMILAVPDRNHDDIIRGMHDVRPAGFWVRVVALLIDVVILLIVRATLALAARIVWGASLPDAMALRSAIGVFTLIFAGAYATVLHAATGQTIGKMLVRAHVVLVDGGAVPIGTSLLRVFGHGVSIATLGLGYLMAGLRLDKRALHDLIAGTRVERRLPTRATIAPEPPEAVVPPVA
jgi:uncharacterized RDD family membrane protein YckC